MSFSKFAAACVLALFATQAGAACTPIRIGYVNQDRPPYWLGDGYDIPTPPGASVELIADFAISAGCQISLVRLPVMRVRSSLENGSIDFAPVEDRPDNPPGIVFPKDRQGKLDYERAVRIVVVTFVRASDKLPADTDPMTYLKGHSVGTTHGAAYAASLRKLGMNVDDGAVDVARNLEKLKLGRIDALAVSLILPNDMDNFVAARFGKDIVRLEKPISTAYIWLATNQDYYDQHRDQVEAAWNWLGGPGRQRFATLLKKYTH
ncbi:MAG: transporter substrate-binding domain-containing protein [Pseudomonadota bacterium]